MAKAGLMTKNLWPTNIANIMIHTRTPNYAKCTCVNGSGCQLCQMLCNLKFKGGA